MRLILEKKHFQQTPRGLYDDIVNPINGLTLFNNTIITRPSADDMCQHSKTFVWNTFSTGFFNSRPGENFAPWVIVMGLAIQNRKTWYITCILYLETLFLLWPTKRWIYYTWTQNEKIKTNNNRYKRSTHLNIISSDKRPLFTTGGRAETFVQIKLSSEHLAVQRENTFVRVRRERSTTEPLTVELLVKQGTTRWKRR